MYVVVDQHSDVTWVRFSHSFVLQTPMAFTSLCSKKVLVWKKSMVSPPSHSTLDETGFLRTHFRSHWIPKQPQEHYMQMRWEGTACAAESLLLRMLCVPPGFQQVLVPVPVFWVSLPLRPGFRRAILAGQVIHCSKTIFSSQKENGTRYLIGLFWGITERIHVKVSLRHDT